MFLKTEISLPCSQQLDICSYAAPNKSIPHYLISFFLDPGKYCTPVYSTVFQVVFLLYVTAPKTYMHITFPHTCHMSSPSRSPTFDYPSDVWRVV